LGCPFSFRYAPTFAAMKYAGLIFFTLSVLQSFAQEEITAEPPEEVIATPDYSIGDETPVMEISPDWEQLMLEQRKKAVVKYQENGLFGLKRGDQILTPAVYSWLDVPSSMYGPTCWAKRNGKYGILSRDGREVIPCEFDETVDALEFGDRSLYKVVKDGKSGVMDTNQVLRIPIVYTSLYSSRVGLYSFRDNKAGFFNTKLEEVVPCEYDRCAALHSKSPVLKLVKGDVIRLVHASDGRELAGMLQRVDCVEDSYHNQGHYLERDPRGLHKSKFAVTTSDGQVGVIHAENGELIIPPSFDAITQCFNRSLNDYYVVSKNGRYGLLSDVQKLVIPLKYDTLVMDCINPHEPDSPNPFALLARSKGKWGVVWSDGTVAVPLSYSEVRAISQGEQLFFKAKVKGKWTVINAKGESITKQEFDHVGWMASGVSGCIIKGSLHHLKSDGSVSGPLMPMEVPQGFETLDEVLRAFRDALVAQSDESMTEFGRRISPDAYAMEYMQRNGLSYRGIPDDIRSKGYTAEDLRVELTQPLVRFRERFHFAGLPFLTADFEEYETGQLDFLLNVRVHESVVRLNTGSDDWRPSFKLGELLFIDGRWLTFTKPRKL
jgi:hypothetical protein